MENHSFHINLSETPEPFDAARNLIKQNSQVAKQE
jgi:hypothetical protein